jgi:phosphate transport system protein
MERHFHNDLVALRERLSEMAGRAETALTKAMEALRTRNGRLAEEVLADDAGIDAIELEVEAKCLQFLGLQQPVARDLRFIVASIRLSNDLERIGDHAVNIAQGALNLSLLPPIKPPDELPRLGERARAALKDSVSAWLQEDVDLARLVCERDSEIDSDKAQVFAALSRRMLKERESVPGSLELLLISRNLERVGDLSTNIAEEAIFVAEARVIKHHADERSDVVG